MTLVLNFRTQDVAGSVADAPLLVDVDATVSPLRYRMVPRWEWDRRVRDRNVLFLTHGFNVHGPDGVCALAGFEERLGLGDDDLGIAVIWPGDWWIPAINYPFEGGTAMTCGRKLAAWCADRLGSANSVSFVSHSLGARLVLETLKTMAGMAATPPQLLPARLVCLMAGAVNRDCFDREYQVSGSQAGTIEVLASRSDWVLHLAFPAGDLIADAIDPDHVPLTAALGREGPARGIPGKLTRPWQIADSENFVHGDYLPSASPPPPAETKWREAADFVAARWRDRAPAWPGLT